jgi:hypothetical protein
VTIGLFHGLFFHRLFFFHGFFFLSGVLFSFSSRFFALTRATGH